MTRESAQKPGTVYLVGAGPGDPLLITLRGVKCLSEADVVIYDALANALLLEHAPRGAERVPVGKRHGVRVLAQNEINDLLIEHARAGKTVVRLKGGDPCIFGRGGEEMQALRAANIPFEIVPGVTAGIAAPAYAGIPITHRELASSVAFVTGHEDPAKPNSLIDWASLAAFPGTLVLYMGVHHLASLAEALIKNGKSANTSVAVIGSGTTVRQRTITGELSGIAERALAANLCSPAVIVVGPVAQFAETLHWFEDRPLSGQSVVLTRPSHQTLRDVDQLTCLGADVLLLPALRIEPPGDWSPVDRAIAGLSGYSWIVFTSANGVRSFLQRLRERNHDARTLGGIRIAAIGTATADELDREARLRADLVPDDSNSESLVESLRAAAGGRLLLLRAEQARDALPSGLAAAAIEFDDVPVYRMVDETRWEPAVLDRMARGAVDWITMTSPRIARALAAHLPAEVRVQVGRTVKIASISPLTSEAVRECGWSVSVEAPRANLESLIDALIDGPLRQK